jgi:hypothetical protein
MATRKTTAKKGDDWRAELARRRQEAKKRQPAKEGETPTQMQVLDAVGIDNICKQIIDGVSLREIGNRLGLCRSALLEWIAEDKERTKRAAEARILSAMVWDEKAEEGLLDATDFLSLTRARDLAHHYRWRASKIAPRQYGDKVQVAGADDLPPIRAEGKLTMSPAEAYARLVAAKK